MGPRISLVQEEVPNEAMPKEERSDAILDRLISSLLYIGSGVAIFFGAWYTFAGFTFPWWAPWLSLVLLVSIESRRLLRCR